MSETGNSKGGVGAGIWISIVAAIVLIIGGFLVPLVGIRVPWGGDNQLSNLGSFGSFLQGTTSALWSLAGVLLIVATFLAQQQQLKDQDRQFEHQNESVKWQRFESSFFHLLGLHNQIVETLRHREPERIYPVRPQQFEGRDCFERWYDDMKGCFFEMRVQGANPTPTFVNPRTVEDVSALGKLYLNFYRGHQAEVGHYFRNLYHLFKFVAESKIPDEEKRRYTSLVRAQLSQYELALLFYNALTPIPPETTNKFKGLIERFGLLENLNLDLLVDRERDVRFYDKAAFR